MKNCLGIEIGHYRVKIAYMERGELKKYVSERIETKSMTDMRLYAEFIQDVLHENGILCRKDFEDWIAKDIHFLRLVAHKIAYKLYRSSYNRGARLFYPPQFILLDYVLRAAAMEQIEKKGHIVIRKTRQQLYEECGITVKTLNRTIKKLEEDRVISVEKGKITMNLEEYKRAREMVHHYISY